MNRELFGLCLAASVASCSPVRGPVGPEREASAPAGSRGGEPAAPGPTAAAPPVSFFGLTARARTIVFVGEASDFALGGFGTVKSELTRAVTRLSPDQRFNIVMSNGVGESAPLDANPLPATPENKRRAFAYLDEVSGRASALLPLLDAAFQGRPDVVFVLSDGDVPEPAAVVAKIRRLNASGHTRVYTVAFSWDLGSVPEPAFADFMRRIAKENGGEWASRNPDFEM